MPARLPFSAGWLSRIVNAVAREPRQLSIFTRSRFSSSSFSAIWRIASLRACFSTSISDFFAFFLPSSSSLSIFSLRSSAACCFARRAASFCSASREISSCVRMIERCLMFWTSLRETTTAFDGSWWGFRLGPAALLEPNRLSSAPPWPVLLYTPPRPIEESRAADASHAAFSAHRSLVTPPNSPCLLLRMQAESVPRGRRHVLVRALALVARRRARKAVGT